MLRHTSLPAIRFATKHGLFALCLITGMGCGTPDAQAPQAPEPMQPPMREVTASVDYSTILAARQMGGMALQPRALGNLAVPTGKLVASDPLVLPDIPSFTRDIRPGTYPVVAYTVDTEQGGVRNALVEVQLGDTKAQKWVLAVRPGEDIAQLQAMDDYFGFPVDAGVAGIFDEQVGRSYRQVIDAFYRARPQGNFYVDVLEDAFQQQATQPEEAGLWANFSLPDSSGNVIMFQSGYGDGVFPAFWGIDAEGQPTALIIDFLVADPGL